MKILSAKQVKEADAFTIKNEPIKSIDLMERASLACFDWIISRFDKDKPFVVFAGIGNNGGDGLAIARMLAEKGYSVLVYLVQYSRSFSKDFSINLERVKRNKAVIIETLTDTKYNLDKEKLCKSTVIDAIFGSGLNRAAKGLALKVINDINVSLTEVISIDIPSGLYADENSANDFAGVVKATSTLSLELPKLSYMFSEHAALIGDFFIIPIGLDHSYIETLDSPFFYINQTDIKVRLQPRLPFSHKGSYGHSLLIAGSYGMMGAAALACRSCLRSGAGLVTAMVPGCGYEIMQSSVPEVMVMTGDEVNFLSGQVELEKYTSYGIGPGIGQHPRTLLLLKAVLIAAKGSLVIDADGINLMAKDKSLLKYVPENSVLTPHPGEFDRLVGKSESGYERMVKQLKFSKEHKVVVVLKGKHTSISTPDGHCYFNSSGNPGMATAGSGDVLTGLITGLLAQGYQPLDASIIAVYIHGLAGDIVAGEVGEQGMIAGDIIENIGNAFRIIER